jgi:hypothetical protein
LQEAVHPRIGVVKVFQNDTLGSAAQGIQHEPFERGTGGFRQGRKSGVGASERGSQAGQQLMQNPHGANADEGLARGLKRFLDKALLTDPRWTDNQPRPPRSKRGSEFAHLLLPAN